MTPRSGSGLMMPVMMTSSAAPVLPATGACLVRSCAQAPAAEWTALAMPGPEPEPEPGPGPEPGRGSLTAAPPRAQPASLGLRSRAQPHRGGFRTLRRRLSRRTRTRTTAACPVPSATAQHRQAGNSRAGARTRMRPSHPFGLKSCAHQALLRQARPDKASGKSRRTSCIISGIISSSC